MGNYIVAGGTGVDAIVAVRCCRVVINCVVAGGVDDKARPIVQWYSVVVNEGILHSI